MVASEPPAERQGAVDRAKKGKPARLVKGASWEQYQEHASDMKAALDAGDEEKFDAAVSLMIAVRDGALEVLQKYKETPESSICTACGDAVVVVPIPHCVGDGLFCQSVGLLGTSLFIRRGRGLLTTRRSFSDMRRSAMCAVFVW